MAPSLSALLTFLALSIPLLVSAGIPRHYADKTHVDKWHFDKWHFDKGQADKGQADKGHVDTAGVGKARVINRCAEPVYVWSVGATISAPVKLAAGHGNYTETLHSDPKTGGIAIKITRTANGLYDGSPQTIFAYNLADDKLWYDLSDVFGNPFAGRKLAVVSTDSSCPSILWPTGLPPGPSQVKVCPSTKKDIVLTLCG